MTAAKMMNDPSPIRSHVSSRGENALEILQPLAEELWIAEQDFNTAFMGNIGTRMTVIRLPHNELFIHAPVQLTEHVRRDLIKLGTPRYLVGCAANDREDLAQYQHSFPSLKMYGTPHLLRKLSDLTFYGTLTDDSASTLRPWSDAIDQHFISGRGDFEEVIFFHQKSKSLIVADLFCHLPAAKNWLQKKARQLFAGENQLRIPRPTRKALRKSMVREKAALWLDARGPIRIVLRHGDIFEGSAEIATEQLSQA